MQMEFRAHKKFIVEWSFHALSVYKYSYGVQSIFTSEGLGAMLQSSREKYSSMYSMLKYIAVIK